MITRNQQEAIDKKKSKLQFQLLEMGETEKAKQVKWVEACNPKAKKVGTEIYGTGFRDGWIKAVAVLFDKGLIKF